MIPTQPRINSACITVILWLLLISCPVSATRSVLLIHTDTGVHSFTVTTATSQYKQLTGLHGWESLAEDEGMLFVFSEQTQRAFSMKHISIPLDILFIDSQGRIVDIVQHAQPGSDTPLVAGQTFLATLEINADMVSQLGVAKGDQVTHPLLDSAAATPQQQPATPAPPAE